MLPDIQSEPLGVRFFRTVASYLAELYFRFAQFKTFCTSEASKGGEGLVGAQKDLFCLTAENDRYEPILPNAAAATNVSFATAERLDHAQ